MDKIVTNEAVFDEESPFTAYSVEKFVNSQAHKSFFFKEWIRSSYDPANTVIILSSNDDTDQSVQVLIRKDASGYYLEISKHSL